jgi:hypothetical protein
LSALFTDNKGECVDFIDFNSCEEGYRKNSSGLNICFLCEDGYSLIEIDEDYMGCRKDENNPDPD